MPRLRILAGPSLTELVPIEANSDVPTHIKSDGFDGQVAVYIKGFEGGSSHSPYFDHEKRKGITWSIQVQGRFLDTHCADDILFGNVFDRPLKLPWGFGAVLKFMKYVDPSLTEDFASRSRPWAFSPFVATMPHIHHTRTDESHSKPYFPRSRDPIAEDTSRLRTRTHTIAHGKFSWHKDRKQRKAHFANEAKRKEVVFGPNDLITADFCHHYLHFGSESIVLRLPGGISIDLLRYWDGQPVRFVCCQRAREGEQTDGLPWGKVFFCVALECEDDSRAEKRNPHVRNRLFGLLNLHDLLQVSRREIDEDLVLLTSIRRDILRRQPRYTTVRLFVHCNHGDSMPRLRILAGPSPAALTPISANSGEATDVSSEFFEGKVAVYIKNFADPNGNVRDSEYFASEVRKDVTWSIQVQGRFLKEFSANNILFGNVFDRPLPIPWGFSTILGFMQ
ncbi:hypothetical protein NM688_g8683 [Phlebia brevispora]|uniref:Uncharacterized protein n=1 Tax=Phlebia brevispora TaxID=194682 RepID=A0ACC1RRR0_9APHY|nr:hypothetical protein NM688_g8683 [Phlebia brevispora]